MQKHIAIGLIAAGGRVLNLRAIVAPGTTTSVLEQNLKKFDKITSLDALRYLVSHRNVWVSSESLGVHFKQEMIRFAVGSEMSYSDLTSSLVTSSQNEPIP